jgi:hypothetical protein
VLDGERLDHGLVGGPCLLDARRVPLTGVERLFF